MEQTRVLRESLRASAVKNRLNAILFAILALAPAIALCDWDDHFGHFDSDEQKPFDPGVDFFVSTVLIIGVASSAILFLGGPVILLSRIIKLARVRCRSHARR